MFLHVHLIVATVIFITTAIHHRYGNYGKPRLLAPELSPRIGFVRTISQAQCETYTGRNNLTFAFTYLGVIFMCIEYQRTKSWFTNIHMVLPLLSLFPLSDHEMGETVICFDIPSVVSRVIHIVLLFTYVGAYSWVLFCLNPGVNTFLLVIGALLLLYIYLIHEEYVFWVEIAFLLGFAFIHLNDNIIYPTNHTLSTVQYPWVALQVQSLRTY